VICPVSRRHDILDQGRFHIVLPVGFSAVNLRFTINGLQYGNLPMMTMNQGERVRWHLLTIGFRFNFHTPDWHGNVSIADTDGDGTNEIWVAGWTNDFILNTYHQRILSFKVAAISGTDMSLTAGPALDLSWATMI
jgi:hypothetical protein